MQVKPSASLFHALSGIGQHNGTRPQIRSQETEVARAEPQGGARAGDLDIRALAEVFGFEPPPPGVPVRRGLLVDILA